MNISVVEVPPTDFPFRRVDRVLRPASYIVARVALGAIYAFVIVGVVMATMVLTHVASSGVGMVLFFIVVGTFSGFTIAWILLVVATVLLARRELRRCGYAYRPVLNATQLSGRSGVVIREAGDPLLSVEEWKARTAAAEAWAKRNPAR